MEELIYRLKAKGFTKEQSIEAVTIIKEYAKEKLPLFSGAIEKLFSKYSKEEDDFLE